MVFNVNYIRQVSRRCCQQGMVLSPRKGCPYSLITPTVSHRIRQVRHILAAATHTHTHTHTCTHTHTHTNTHGHAHTHTHTHAHTHTYTHACTQKTTRTHSHRQIQKGLICFAVIIIFNQLRLATLGGCSPLGHSDNASVVFKINKIFQEGFFGMVRRNNQR